MSQMLSPTASPQGLSRSDALCAIVSSVVQILAARLRTPE